MKKYKGKLQVGSLDSKKQAAPVKTQAAKKGTPVKPKAEAGTGSAEPAGPIEEEFNPPLDTFGDLVPYADPNWYQSVSLKDNLLCAEH